MSAGEEGSWVVTTPVGALRDRRPVADGGVGHLIFGSDAGRLPDEVAGGGGARDDPSLLVWSTYLGGSNRDFGWGIVLDADENPVVTGNT